MSELSNYFGSTNIDALEDLSLISIRVIEEVYNNPKYYVTDDVFFFKIVFNVHTKQGWFVPWILVIF